ncbi:hypothetical protein LINPERHAP1_LOCUS38169 [Linum perenne]
MTSSSWLIRFSTFVSVLLLALALLCSARYTFVSFSGTYKEAMLSEGRSLKVSLADYGETSANKGHDPPSSRVRGHHGGGGGRHRRHRSDRRG